MPHQIEVAESQQLSAAQISDSDSSDISTAAAQVSTLLELSISKES